MNIELKEKISNLEQQIKREYYVLSFIDSKIKDYSRGAFCLC